MSAIGDAVLGRTSLAAPIVYQLAARLEQVPLDEMRDDPATAAFVLRAAQGLFDLRVVVNVLTPRFETDDAQLDAAVDVTARLADELRGKADVVGVLTGPATLESPDRDVYAKAARRYADAGAAAVLVAERPDAVGGDTAVLGELANICRFYSIPSILLAPAGDPPDAPVDVVLGERDVLRATLLREAPADPPEWTGLLLTDDEVPADADPEFVIAWMQVLARGSR